MSTGKLAAAIGAVIQAVGSVAKDGQNQHFKYRFTSEAAILRAVREAMAENGLALLPTGVQHLGTEQIGQKRYRTEVVVSYLLAHPSGESAVVMVPGAGADAEDKGPYKAMTGCLKYALRQTFLIPTGDDPEDDSQQNRPAPARQPQRRQRPPENQWRNNGGAAPSCPDCGSALWDNCQDRREGSKRPAWKCKSRDGCEWLQWEIDPRPGAPRPDDTDPQQDDGPPPWSDQEVF